MKKRPNDYLWICFNPSRIIQGGPTGRSLYTGAYCP
jgi:hypothetical protein